MTAPTDAAPSSGPSSGSNAQKAPIEAAGSANDPAGKRPSARRLARLGTILFFDGFRAAPGWMALVTAMLVLGSIAATCYLLGYKLLADGALDGNEGELVEGVAVVAVLLGLAWVLVGIGATEAMALSDRIAVYRTRRMIELISGVPTLEHLERPDGLATFIGRDNTGGQNLSGGQWQKLALGRAMRTPDPLLVVLDEPTASLDAHAEQALFDRYTSAAAGYAAKSGTVTLLVSHRFATVRMADLIVYLEEGHVIEAGTHDELLARGGRYAELFTLQAQGYR